LCSDVLVFWTRFSGRYAALLFWDWSWDCRVSLDSRRFYWFSVDSFKVCEPAPIGRYVDLLQLVLRGYYLFFSLSGLSRTKRGRETSPWNGCSQTARDCCLYFCQLQPEGVFRVGIGLGLFFRDNVGVAKCVASDNRWSNRMDDGDKRKAFGQASSEFDFRRQMSRRIRTKRMMESDV